MRKPGFLFVLILLLLFGSALAEELAIDPVSEVIRPGRAVQLTFSVPEAGEISLTLEDAQGQRRSVVVENYSAAAGVNHLWWNGSHAGVLAPAGDALLVLRMGDSHADTPVTIGTMAPYLTSIRAENNTLTPTQPLAVTFYASEAGTLSLGLQQGNAWQEVKRQEIDRGEQTVTWTADGQADGACLLTLQLMEASGDTSSVETLSIVIAGFDTPAETPAVDPDLQAAALIPLEEIEEEELPLEDELTLEEDEPSASALPAVDQSQFTPSYGSPYAGQDETVNYWTLPMDITDEAAVWDMLMQPMTVLDNGKKDAEKLQIVIRSEPDSSSTGIGVVTCLSQGVHVLERGDTWTLIEFYSSSFHDSKVKAWNMLRQGWVETKYLKEVTPNQDVAYVVDKLTQRLYVFREGKLYDTLLVSTGEANAKQPYNETRSGEFFMMVPAMGGFTSGNLFCAMAIRFNDGDAIHEVPYLTTSDGGKSYATTEYKLGTRASHGCIRVQRRLTPLGTNMKWIWDHRAKNTKLVIWEDWQGRQYATPSDDTVLYYNPSSGSYYHTCETCNSAKGVTFTAFTYGELDDAPYAKLKRCEWCAAPLRKAEIEAINANYLPGGDHDPIITKARQDLGLIP